MIEYFLLGNLHLYIAFIVGYHALQERSLRRSFTNNTYTNKYGSLAFPWAMQCFVSKAKFEPSDKHIVTP